MVEIQPYDFRGRVGMLKPSPVTDTNAHEFYLMAPEGVELFIVSYGSPGMTQSDLLGTLERVVQAVPALAEYDVGVLIQAGIPHLAAIGYGVEERLRAEVAKVTSIPFLTDFGVCIDAMRTLGISHPVVISPIFDDEMYGQIASYLAEVDIDLVASARVGDALEKPQPPPLVPLDAVLRVARDLYTANSSTADGIWISGAAMPSVTVIEALEAELAVPVISSSQAMMWAGLRAIGINDEIAGFGRLLRSAQPGF